MKNPLLIKSVDAGADVPAYRIVKHGSADTMAVPAAGATDGMFGVSDDLGASAGERLDVIIAGVAEVMYGGDVQRGDLVTSDSDGRAVTASPSTGENMRVIGVAMESGTADAVGSVLINPGQIQG